MESIKGQNRNKTFAIMEAGRFYDLKVPAKVKGEIYDRIQCEFQHPKDPNEYVVRGIPRGEFKMKSFLLKFTEGGAVKVILSAKQEKY